MATSRPNLKAASLPKPKKSSAWKQGVNKPKTNWASKSAVNRPRTQRAQQFKLG